MRHQSSSRIGVALALILAFGGREASADESVVEINTCGQVLQGGGFLSADLDCSAETVNAPTVILGNNGTLDLRGFTLTGRSSSGFLATVFCSRHCTILGPGTIVGSSVSNNLSDDLQNVVGTDNDHLGGSIVDVENATITGGGLGIYAHQVNVDHAVITNNRSVGVWSWRVKIDDSEISGNGLGSFGMARHGVLSVIKTRVRNSTIAGNARSGVSGRRLSIIDSTVTDNQVYSDCTTKVCVDLEAEALRVPGTTCGTSLDSTRPSPSQPGSFVGQPITDSYKTFGVCTDD